MKMSSRLHVRRRIAVNATRLMTSHVKSGYNPAHAFHNGRQIWEPLFEPCHHMDVVLTGDIVGHDVIDTVYLQLKPDVEFPFRATSQLLAKGVSKRRVYIRESAAKITSVTFRR